MAGPSFATATAVEAEQLTYRIHRSATPDTVTFMLSGEMDIEHVTRLQELIAKEAHDRTTLDLKDITIVDRAALRFLAGAEATGIRIINHQVGGVHS